MSTSCMPSIGSFSYDASCGCTLVDFDFTIRGLCNHSKYGIILGVYYGGRLVATVCDIFKVDVRFSEACSCVEVTRHYKGIITDVDCCEEHTEAWDVRPLQANYIYGCQHKA